MIKCYILSNLRSNACYNHTILLECFTHGAEQSGQNVADTSLRYLLVPPSHFLFSLGYLATCNTLSGMVGTYSCWLIDKILHELKIVCHFKTVLVHYPNWSRGSYSSTLRNDILYIYHSLYFQPSCPWISWGRDLQRGCCQCGRCHSKASTSTRRLDSKRIASRPPQLNGPLHQSNIAGLKSTICRCIYFGAGNSDDGVIFIFNFSLY